jgi:hypothetical protein
VPGLQCVAPFYAGIRGPPLRFIRWVKSSAQGAKHVSVNLLRYFYEPATLDSEARAFLQRGMALAMEWATQGLVVPHVSQTIDTTATAINAGLQSLKAGRGILGKVAVIVDRDLAAGK